MESRILTHGSTLPTWQKPFMLGKNYYKGLGDPSWCPSYFYYPKNGVAFELIEPEFKQPYHLNSGARPSTENPTLHKSVEFPWTVQTNSNLYDYLRRPRENVTIVRPSQRETEEKTKFRFELGCIGAVFLVPVQTMASNQIGMFSMYKNGYKKNHTPVSFWDAIGGMVRKGDKNIYGALERKFLKDLGFSPRKLQFPNDDVKRCKDMLKQHLQNIMLSDGNIVLQAQTHAEGIDRKPVWTVHILVPQADRLTKCITNTLKKNQQFKSGKKDIFKCLTDADNPSGKEEWSDVLISTRLMLKNRKDWRFM